MKRPHPLRSYRTIARAESFARVLRARFPNAVFDVVPSPFQAYAFRYLIKVTKGDRGIVGGDVYVGR